MCARPRPRSLLRSLPRLSLGARTALLGGLVGGCVLLGPAALRRAPSPAVVAWAVDRDGGALHGLGAGGLLRRRLAVVSPVLAAIHPRGGLWVVEAVERLARGRHRLVHVELTGRRRELATFERAGSGRPDALGLDGSRALLPAFRGGVADPAGLWLLLGTGDREEGLWRVEVGAPPREALALPDARLLVAGQEGGRLLVVVGRDELVLLRTAGGPRLRARRRVEERVRAACPAPGGGWWVLAESAPRVVPADGEAPATDLTEPALPFLLSLDEELRPRATRPLPPEPWQLRSGDAGTWLFAPRSGRLDRPAGDDLALLPDELPLEGLAAACAGPDGEAWLAGPGCVVALDRLGAPAWAQGGFARLAGLVPVRLRAGR